MGLKLRVLSYRGERQDYETSKQPYAMLGIDLSVSLVLRKWIPGKIMDQTNHDGSGILVFGNIRVR